MRTVYSCRDDPEASTSSSSSPLFPHTPHLSPPPHAPSSPGDLSTGSSLLPPSHSKPEFPPALLTGDTTNKPQSIAPSSSSFTTGPPSPQPPQFSPPFPHISPLCPTFNTLGSPIFPPALLTDDKLNLPPSTPTPHSPLFPHIPHICLPPLPPICPHPNATSVLALEPPCLVKDYPLIPDSANPTPARPNGRPPAAAPSTFVILARPVVPPVSRRGSQVTLYCVHGGQVNDVS